MSEALLIRQVLEKYGLSEAKYSVIRDKGKKTVWKVIFPGHLAALKKMPGSPKMTAYLTWAADFLVRAGVKVAPIISTPKGELFVNIEGSTFILSKWLEGKQPDYDRHLELILESMAGFHRGSRGFQAGAAGHVRSHLDTWPDNFVKKKKKMEQVRQIAYETCRDEFSRLCLQYIDHFMESAALAEKKLLQSYYPKWVNRFKKEIGLCHQDFTPKNLRLSNGELYVFDIDSITVDLPARDIRKIINKLMKKKGWDRALLNKIDGLYRRHYPLSDSEWQVVLIDLYFPHLFFGITTKYYGNRAPDWSKDKYLKRLKELSRVELSKEKILTDLI